MSTYISISQSGNQRKMDFSLVFHSVCTIFVPMKRVIIEVGTNINQRDNARLVREDLYAKFGNDIRFSPSMKTKPVDGGDGYYINYLAEIHTDVPYDELRAWFKDLEQECGRNKEDTKDGWVPLDIDILEYDGKRFSEKDWERSYVKELFKEMRIK